MEQLETGEKAQQHHTLRDSNPADPNLLEIERCKCAICGMAFQNTATKEEHERLKQCSTRGAKQCSNCFKIFRNTLKLISHLSSDACVVSRNPISLGALSASSGEPEVEPEIQLSPPIEEEENLSKKRKRSSSPIETPTSPKPNMSPDDLCTKLRDQNSTNLEQDEESATVMEIEEIDNPLDIANSSMNDGSNSDTVLSVTEEYNEPHAEITIQQLTPSTGTELCVITELNDDEAVTDGKHSGKVICPYCPKTMEQNFSTKVKVLGHQRMVHFCYNCPICNEPKRGLFNTQKHLRKIHDKTLDEAKLLVTKDSDVVDIVDGQRKPCSDKFPERCVYCSKRFVSLQGLRHHCESQHIRYRCPVCKEVRRGYYKTRRHMHELHNISKKELLTMKLEECGRPDPVTDPEHDMITAPPLAEGPSDGTVSILQKPPNRRGINYKCEYCLKQFTEADHMRRHISSIHRKLRYECPVCKKLFTFEYGVQKHLLRIHGVPRDKSQNMEFRTLSEIPAEEPQLTLVKLEPDEGVFDEGEMEEKRARSSSTNLMILDRPSGDLEDTQPACTLPVKEDQKLSTRNRGVDLYYTCEYCFQQFSQATHKRRHVNTIHKKLRYECPACKKLLTTETGVQKHLLKIHGVTRDKSRNMEFRTLHETPEETAEVTLVKLEPDECDDDVSLDTLLVKSKDGDNTPRCNEIDLPSPEE